MVVQQLVHLGKDCWGARTAQRAVDEVVLDVDED
jgi:hypothetical protein